MNGRRTLLMLLATVFFCTESCQKYDRWDPDSGNQEIEVTVDPAYTDVSEPTIEKQDGTFYIVSNNDTIDDITPQAGLMVRTTTDLVNMSMADSTAYILSDIVQSKKEELIGYDSSIDTSAVKIREPYLFNTGTNYLLYYSVSAGGSTSLIGVASTSDLSSFEWEDQGTILYSTSSNSYVAACPSVIDADGTKYMVFGNAGIYIVQLASDGLSVSGSPSALISPSDVPTASSPSMVYYDGYYHLFFTVYGRSVYDGASDSPTGDFTDYTGYETTDLNFRVMTPYVINSGTSWGATTGVNVWQDPDDSNWYIVHEAGGSLHVRSLHWIDPDYVTDNFVNGCTHAIAAINPERYTTVEGTTFTTSDFTGTWYFGTLWAITAAGSTNAVSGTTMDFSSDGTFDDGSSGGTWEYNEDTHIMTLYSNSWSEYLVFYVTYASDWDDDDAPVLTAAGTDMYSWYGGCWMQHTISSDEETIEYSRTGIYGPTMGYNSSDGNYYMISGNAAIADNEDSYEYGLPIFSSDELVPDFFNFDGYILSDVIDDWAKARLLELDSSIDTTDILIDHPCLRELSDGTWRLYYSVSAGTQASVIGYATANSPDGTWTDQGEVISSSSSDLYKASCPSFCIGGDGDYLAFGENYGGIYGVELNSDGTTDGDPVLISFCSADDNTAQRVSCPVLFYQDDYYHLYVSYNDQTIVQGAATSALGTYYDYANHDLTASFADCHILTGYVFSDGSYIYTNPNNGIDVFSDDDQTYAVSQFSLNSADPSLSIRKLNFIDPSVTSMNFANLSDGATSLTVAAPFPAISPEGYQGDTYSDEITTDELCSAVWDYGTLWYLYTDGGYNSISTQLQLSADGNYDDTSDTTATVDGTWDYNQTTHILHLYSYEWPTWNSTTQEQIYLYVIWADDNENDDVDQTLVASGVNAVYSLHPGAWMKQQR